MIALVALSCVLLTAVVYACCVVAGRADEQMEELKNERENETSH